MVKACSLSTGSNGNVFFIKTGRDAFLIDAGISRKQICQRLNQIGHSIDEIKGLFITHEHSDHVKGLEILLKYHPLPVYITEKTYASIPVRIDRAYLNLIKPEEKLQLNQTVIEAKSKFHDAADPSLFCFYYRDRKISIITDTGFGCPNVIAAVRDADFIFLESNFDEKMLREGFYPPFLKKRIRGKHGHLSNHAAAALILNYATPKLKYLLLSHLSENNNLPDLVLSTFQEMIRQRPELKKVNTLIGPRYQVSEVITF